MARITQSLAADIKSDFVTRMRTIGKSRKEIAQLALFLGVSLDNINEIDKMNKLNKQ